MSRTFGIVRLMYHAICPLQLIDRAARSARRSGSRDILLVLVVFNGLTITCIFPDASRTMEDCQFTIWVFVNAHPYLHEICRRCWSAAICSTKFLYRTVLSLPTVRSSWTQSVSLTFPANETKAEASSAGGLPNLALCVGIKTSLRYRLALSMDVIPRDRNSCGKRF